ncbi:LOW QUALITY PROTEIN: claspin-like [Daphnia magna]|uniref:LOW QUALITY PROTEIN: claspin-like n=1 Tax=Daphnia magna TaxID=35525 RepID=UPI001E1BCF35|nr:LOW QUALITY PROTEIN: claspin-like [Daphnia magna]
MSSEGPVKIVGINHGDVTFFCQSPDDNNEQHSLQNKLRANRSVLAAASRFFSILLPDCELDLDVCISIDLSFEELFCVLEYIYSGKLLCSVKSKDRILSILKEFDIFVPDHLQNSVDCGRNGSSEAEVEIIFEEAIASEPKTTKDPTNISEDKSPFATSADVRVVNSGELILREPNISSSNEDPFQYEEKLPEKFSNSHKMYSNKSKTHCGSKMAILNSNTNVTETIVEPEISRHKDPVFTVVTNQPTSLEETLESIVSSEIVAVEPQDNPSLNRYAAVPCPDSWQYDFERTKKGKKKKITFVEEETEDSDQDPEDQDQEDSLGYEENDEVKSKSAVQTSNESDDQSNGFEPPLNFEVAAKKLDSCLDQSTSTLRSDVKPSLKGIGCSSSFEDLTPNLDVSDSAEEEDIIPKLKCTQNNETSNVEELLALCSGKFPDSLSGRDTQISSLTENADDESDEEVKPFARIIPMADEDDEEDGSSSALPKFVSENDADEPGTVPSFLEDGEKSLSKVKKRARVCLSDDEDETIDENHSFVEEEEMHEEEREFRGLTEFFEDEAELSGSEVGSGDEMDDWKEEEGDKEDIDENEVREQVGRAHMKTMLDQDQREVRLFQELFLEDGDLHSDGGGRQKQFRWKQADGENTEETARPKNQEDEEDEAAEEQDDLTWRKIHSDREKWLLQQKSQQETNKEVPLVMSRQTKMVKINTASKTINQITEGDSSAATANAKQSTHSKANIVTTVRCGSFLRRSEKDLSEIASLMKSVLPVQAPRVGSNFVFASITPERPVAEQKIYTETARLCYNGVFGLKTFRDTLFRWQLPW